MIKPSKRGMIAILLAIIFISGCFFFKYFQFINNMNTQMQFTYHSKEYRIYNSKCHMIKLDPFDKQVMQFYEKKPFVSYKSIDPLTYVVKNKENTLAKVHINKNVVPSYSYNGIKCCSQEYKRTPWTSRKYVDLAFSYVDKCKYFKDEIVATETTYVECKNGDNKTIYENFHSATIINEAIRKKMQPNNKKDLSVLIIGIDSMSSSNLRRSMPETTNYLLNNNWIEFEAYNKIYDNTFVNLMAFLTGLNYDSIYKLCNPHILNGLDNCARFLLYEFRKRGYVTAYGEDYTSISTFNYCKFGFNNSPTDYYYRPYFYGVEHKLDKSEAPDHILNCGENLTIAERMFDVISDFATTFNGTKTFGLFWMNTFTHNDVNGASRFDWKVTKFLDKLNFDNTVVLFLSDHGFRVGDIVLTLTGWLENRLPYFFIKVPHWFHKAYPVAYNNLQMNSKRLTSPFDIYYTLQALIKISDENYTILSSTGCPKCKSLFEETEIERSCSDAAINEHYCTCYDYSFLDPAHPTATAAAKALTNHINQITSKHKKGKLCAKFSVSEIKWARISHDFHNETNFNSTATRVVLAVKTKPNAIFSATLNLNLRLELIEAFSVTRLNWYASHTRCVGSDDYLQLYCYCRKHVFFY